MKLSRGEKIFQTANYLFLSIMGLFTLYPFVYIFALSLNEGIDSAKGGIYLWPRVFTWMNYKMVLSSPIIQSAYLVTIGRTVIGTFGGLLITALAAYGLSFRQLPGRKMLTFYMLIPILFNGGLIPYYLQLRDLGLLNSFWVYVIPSLFGVWNMFVMRTYFTGIPESLKEAATIDGANQLQILLHIVFPVSLPMLAAIGLFIGVWHWNEWFSGYFFVDDMKLKPVQAILQRLMDASSLSDLAGGSPEQMARNSRDFQMTITAIKMATVMVGTLPILLIYPFLQKYFAKGVLIGSINE